MKQEIDIIDLIKKSIQTAKKKWYVFAVILAASLAFGFFINKNQKLIYSSQAVLYFGDSKIEVGVYKQFFDLINEYILNENHQSVSGFLNIDPKHTKGLIEVRQSSIEEENKSLKVVLRTKDTSSIKELQAGIISFLNNNNLQDYKTSLYKKKNALITGKIESNLKRTDSILKANKELNNSDLGSLVDAISKLESAVISNQYYSDLSTNSIGFLVDFETKNLKPDDLISLKSAFVISIIMSIIIFFSIILFREIWRLVL